MNGGGILWEEAVPIHKQRSKAQACIKLFFKSGLGTGFFMAAGRKGDATFSALWKLELISSSPMSRGDGKKNKVTCRVKNIPPFDGRRRGTFVNISRNGR